MPAAARAPVPRAIALPAGIAAMWDASSLSALADGAPVTSWTDAVDGALAAQTGDSTTPHSFIANSGGLPAVRLSGAAVLATTGANAANTAMSGAKRHHRRGAEHPDRRGGSAAPGDADPDRPLRDDVRLRGRGDADDRLWRLGRARVLHA